MKIIAENPVEQALVDRIRAIAANMADQDNRSTNFPIWTILENGNAGSDYGAVAFLTARAAEEHIREYSHHYDNPGIYVRSAHANEELRDIIHLILTATNNPIDLNHYGRLR